MSDLNIRCRVAHFLDGSGSINDRFEYLDDAVVVVHSGKVIGVHPASQIAALGINESEIIDRRPALMMPGFIDAHVHAPQINMIASYGEQLMDWLNNYTFPEELKYANRLYSKEQSGRFLDALLAHGTTSAFIFTTSFKHSTEDIFDAAIEKNMRLVSGKVLMNRHAPEGLLDGDTGVSDSMALIKQYHNRARVGYAITPRFAGTSTPTQLKQAGDLLKEVPDLWVQTHLSENKQEIEWTASLFPDAHDYLHTYEMHGLHSERSIYAHCIYLTESEKARVADMGSTVAFCPSSNLFLGSGLLDIQQLKDANIDFCLATDVGAGTSLSMLSTLGDAYKVCQLNHYALSALEAFYASTLGAAKTLNIDHFVGNLSENKEADFILLNPSLDHKIQSRIEHTHTIEEELFVYMIMGDERLIEETFLAGRSAYKHPTLDNTIGQ